MQRAIIIRKSFDIKEYVQFRLMFTVTMIWHQKQQRKPRVPNAMYLRLGMSSHFKKSFSVSKIQNPLEFLNYCVCLIVTSHKHRKSQLLIRIPKQKATFLNNWYSTWYPIARLSSNISKASNWRSFYNTAYKTSYKDVTNNWSTIAIDLTNLCNK